MHDVPLSALTTAWVILLALSAVFSMSETAMMASNRFRLRHLAQQGDRRAQRAVDLLGKTDKMLGVILLGNNLVNAAAATLVSVIAIELFGDSEWVLGAGTLVVTFAILVFSEITPKIIGATYADRLALFIPYLLVPLLRGCYPLVWFVNLFVSALLKLFRLDQKAGHEQSRLTTEELRSLVLESSHAIPHKHQTILSGLFELNDITVEDVMTPRGHIEVLDIDQPWEAVMDQLKTSHHSRLPICRGSLDQLVGLLPVRRVVGSLDDANFDEAKLLEHTQSAYYIPAGTAVFDQLTQFQENRQRAGFVVDEYGEILGLVTLEDIIEEFVGDFTTSLPGSADRTRWGEADNLIVEGNRSLRLLNRQLDLSLPIDGPRTLNGLILEHLQDIPEAGVSVKIADVPIEILQRRERSIITVRIFRPKTAESLGSGREPAFTKPDPRSIIGAT